MRHLLGVYIIWYRDLLRFWHDKMRLITSITFPYSSFSFLAAASVPDWAPSDPVSISPSLCSLELSG